MPYHSVYFISYIDIGHVILEKVLGYIVRNRVDFFNGIRFFYCESVRYTRIILKSSFFKKFYISVRQDQFNYLLNGHIALKFFCILDNNNYFP